VISATVMIGLLSIALILGCDCPFSPDKNSTSSHNRPPKFKAYLPPAGVRWASARSEAALAPSRRAPQLQQ
jgi:hypothetical protein